MSLPLGLTLPTWVHVGPLPHSSAKGLPTSFETFPSAFWQSLSQILTCQLHLCGKKHHSWPFQECHYVLDIKPKYYRYTTTTSKSARLVSTQKTSTHLYSLKKAVTTNESPWKYLLVLRRTFCIHNHMQEGAQAPAPQVLQWQSCRRACQVTDSSSLQPNRGASHSLYLAQANYMCYDSMDSSQPACTCISLHTTGPKVRLSDWETLTDVTYP